MSFLAKTPKLPDNAFTAQQQQSTYQNAEVVPIGYGDDMFPSHWLSDAYDRKTAPAQGSNWQYASIVALYRKGPIDWVGQVKVNGVVIADFDYTFGDGEEEHTFILNASLALGDSWRAIEIGRAHV